LSNIEFENLTHEKKTLFQDLKLMSILGSICNGPKSAKEIAINCNIPITTVYRKLRILENQKHLHISRIQDNGVFRRRYETKAVRNYE